MALGILLIGLIVIGLFFLGFVLYVIILFNSLVSLKNNIAKSWSNIDVLLKQRSDEIPNLIESVKGYMKHEKGVLEGVTKARTDFMKAKSMSAKAEADNVLTGALKTLFAVAENYPTLKANENFMHLQGRISGLENELADRREFYNDSVNTYNIRIQSFPDLLLARVLAYQKENLFEATAEERKNVKVKF